MVAPRALILLLVVSLSGAGVGSAPGAECVALDDFSRGAIGEFPPDWKPRKDAGRPVYSIQEEAGQRFLHAAATRSRVGGTTGRPSVTPRA
jgi:hypothetical protein